MEGIIYAYKSPGNKYYIGQTINEDNRKISHAKDTIKTKTKFGCALRKYGYDNFEYTVLIRVSSTDKLMLHNLLDFYEMMYVTKYDSYHNGYNCNRGGGGQGTSSVIVHVNQYSLDGKLIQEWESAACAGRELGLSSHHITSVCKKNTKLKTVGGYLWGYKNEPIPIYNKREVIIHQYDLDHNLMFTYSSLNEASEKTGISKSLIRYNLNDNSGSTHGFIFKKEDSKSVKKKATKPIKKSNRKSVLVFTKEGEFIHEYPSISAVANAFNITDKYASGVCNGRRKTFKGFLFKFKQD